ncbi:MAG TPA: DUF362 domain-containing protein [Methanoregulaceae archaeon]|jgi:uncharacterized protein (DUF362 family)/NAD-dependent dihydropyrimidine dehydrogenase PreA subunit|nr:DUF362 domain-containing protein [Methanoregulaceae archaeon]
MAGSPVKTVALARCTAYDREEVTRSVRQVVDLLGGIESFISPGSRVLVKPNLLQGLPPERCVTTHPEVVRAVCVLLRSIGCSVVIADSPGGGIRYTPASLRSLYHAAGYDQIAAETGALLNYDTGFYEHPFPEGRLAKRFPVILPVRDADHIVVVSKAKTHLWTLFSGGAKNLFGVIPGLEKPLHHARFRETLHFGGMIADLNEAISPSLQLMDAVVAMEGDGPSSGSPRPLGAILASPDWTAIDVVACRLIGIPPLDVPTIRAVADRGGLPNSGADIILLGDDPATLAATGFRMPSTYRGEGKGLEKSLLLGLLHRLGGLYALYPVIDHSRCERCRRCERICPVHAISWSGGTPEITRSACIRCYCCHEICPVGAIATRPGLTRRMIGKVTGLS